MKKTKEKVTKKPRRGGLAKIVITALGVVGLAAFMMRKKKPGRGVKIKSQRKSPKSKKRAA